MSNAKHTIADLLYVMQRLRDPEKGCPWDVQQTFASIVPSTLEECYELAAAIEDGDQQHIKEELGDVLFQVIFYAQMATEQGTFDFSDVVTVLVEKLVRRHPHVFPDGDHRTSADAMERSVDKVGERWEEIKATERAGRSMGGLLDDVPLALPALPRAQKLQKRAARAGFDWKSVDEVFAKLDEEIAEMKRAQGDQTPERVAEELGDVMFTCVNLARHLSLDAESVMRAANRRFEQRFRDMEQQAESSHRTLHELDSDTMETLWADAKARLERGL